MSEGNENPQEQSDQGGAPAGGAQSAVETVRAKAEEAMARANEALHHLQDQAGPMVEQARAKAEEAMSKAGEALHHLQDQAGPMVDQARVKAEEAMSKAGEALQNAQDQAEPTLEKAKEAVGHAVETVKEFVEGIFARVRDMLDGEEGAEKPADDQQPKE